MTPISSANTRRANSAEKPAGAAEALSPSSAQAEATLSELANTFLQNSALAPHLPARRAPGNGSHEDFGSAADEQQPNVEARYRALVEQIPAVVFMAYLDRGIGEAYVSPQIETTLGFSQQEWLEDPVRWYRHIHPDDKQRWSTETAQMFLSGKPLRSAYRVIARSGQIIWFHCEAKMIRRTDGRPWFIHGSAFDITELKRTEECLHEERNVAAAILDTVGALVVVLDPAGRIVRFNRACEQTTGYSFDEVAGQRLWDLFMIPEEVERFRVILSHLRSGESSDDYESHWVNRRKDRRLIAWSSTALRSGDGEVTHIIATGIDITERKRLENTILEISAREQRRIGQDLHDGLGQHLTGIAFMSKVLEEKLAERYVPEAADAAKIVKLVNEAINNTRELAHGLLPVVSEAQGLMSALEHWANKVEDLFKVSCWFQCVVPVLIYDDTLATHLYHIAEEAVNNAIKHGNAKHIVIGLSVINGAGALTVQDDGQGFLRAGDGQRGMGLHIMDYRAKMIGGSLVVQGEAGHGTLVTCLFPAPDVKGNGGSP